MNYKLFLALFGLVSVYCQGRDYSNNNNNSDDDGYSSGEELSSGGEEDYNQNSSGGEEDYHHNSSGDEEDYRQNSSQYNSGGEDCGCMHNCPYDLAVLAVTYLRSNICASTLEPNVLAFQSSLADGATLSFLYLDPSSHQCRSSTVTQAVQGEDGRMVVHSDEDTSFGRFTCVTVFEPYYKGSCQYRQVSVKTVQNECASLVVPQ